MGPIGKNTRLYLIQYDENGQEIQTELDANSVQVDGAVTLPEHLDSLDPFNSLIPIFITPATYSARGISIKLHFDRATKKHRPRHSRVVRVDKPGRGLSVRTA